MPSIPTPHEQPIRLNKFLAHAGLASRRTADALIQQGRVQVNGRAVEAPGVMITPGRDRVTVDGQEVKGAAHDLITLLLNKPHAALMATLTYYPVLTTNKSSNT